MIPPGSRARLGVACASTSPNERQDIALGPEALHTNDQKVEKGDEDNESGACVMFIFPTEDEFQCIFFPDHCLLEVPACPQEGRGWVTGLFFPSDLFFFV